MATVWVATTRVWITSQRTESSSIRTGMWVTVTSGSKRFLAHSTRSLRVKPKRVSEAQESSTSPGSWARTASSSASDGSRSITSPTDSIPYSERIDIVTSTRARAASRSSPESISWPTAGWFCGAATATKGTFPARSRTACSSLRPPATSLRKTSRGRASEPSLIWIPPPSVAARPEPRRPRRP